MGCGQSQVRVSDEKIAAAPDQKKKRRKKNADKKTHDKVLVGKTGSEFQQVVPAFSPASSDKKSHGKGKRKKKKKRSGSKDNTIELKSMDAAGKEKEETDFKKRGSKVSRASQSRSIQQTTANADTPSEKPLVKYDSAHNMANNSQIKVKIHLWLSELLPIDADDESPCCEVQASEKDRSSVSSDVHTCVKKLSLSEVSQTSEEKRPSLSIIGRTKSKKTRQAELACVPKASWHQSCAGSTVVQSGEEWMYQLDELQKEYETGQQQKKRGE